jgi:hypothetical protein
MRENEGSKNSRRQTYGFDFQECFMLFLVR